MPSTHRLTPELQAEVDATLETERQRRLLPPDKGPSSMAIVTNHAKGPRFLPVTIDGGAPQYAILAPGETATLRLDANVMNTPVFKAMVAAGDFTVDNVEADEDTEHAVTHAGRLGAMNTTLPAGEIAQAQPGHHAETEANVPMPVLPMKARKAPPPQMPDAEPEGEAEAPPAAPEKGQSPASHRYK